MSARATPSPRLNEAVSLPIEDKTAAVAPEPAATDDHHSAHISRDSLPQQLSVSPHDLTYRQSNMKHQRKDHNQGTRVRRQENSTTTSKPLAVVDDTKPWSTDGTRLQPESQAARVVFNTVSLKETLIYT